MSIDLKVKRTHPAAFIPSFATMGAACFDLHAITEGEVTECLMPGSAHVFQIGLAFEIPEGYALMIYSRSGAGFKNDVRLANCTGVIDADYRGSVAVKLTNDNADGRAFKVKHGDRIAQAMLIEVPIVRLVEVLELSTTARGAGGFGSTGSAAQ